MAEVIGLVASVMTLAKAARVVCKSVHELHDLFGNLPGRLVAVSNEVADLEIVLGGARACLDGERGEGKAETGMAALIATLSDELVALTAIIAEIKKAGSESKFAQLQRGYAWKKHHGRLNDVQDNIVRAKSNLNLLVSACTTNDVKRIHTQLNSLRSQALTQHTEIKGLLASPSFEQLLEQQLTITAARMQQDSQRLRANRSPRLHPKALAARAARSGNASSSASRGPVDKDQGDADADADETMRLAVSSSIIICPRGCPCQCHDSRRTQTPGVAGRILGQLFVGYSGLPVLSAKCDHSICKRNEAPQVQVEYWFPIGLVWSKIFHLRASYQAATGPSLQLRTFRRVPDSAAAVNYSLSGNVSGLKLLFSQGLASPVDVSDTRGYSLLRWAVYAQQWEAARFLYDAGADADYRPKALSDNSPRNKASDLLLQGGLEQQAVEVLTRISRQEDWLEDQNFPILHKIIVGISGRDPLDQLQQHPESVDAKDAMGRTALLWAAARGDARAVTMLLWHHADHNIMDVQHAGPVSYAADRNHAACVRILLEAGADPDPVIPGGYKIGSPLNCAARNASDPLIIKSLLEFGAQVDACGVDGRTSLIHAARTDNVEFALLLLEHNADINAMSAVGQTSLTTAITNNSHGVLGLLLERWEQYSNCPRLKGPHMLKITAQYADLETISMLVATNHFRLKHDKGYCVGDFETLLNQRLDNREKLSAAFAELMDIVRREAESQTGHDESLMEQGLAFHPSESVEEYTQRIVKGGEPILPPYSEHCELVESNERCPVVMGAGNEQLRDVKGGQIAI